MTVTQFAVRSTTFSDKLDKIRGCLMERSLERDEWQAFFATLWPWCQETQSGMLALALKLLEDWLIVNPWQASQRVAPLLSTIVDEFGLNAEFAYQQLFLHSAEKMGVTAEVITNPRCILFSGKKLGALIHEYYHKRGTATALGFHQAVLQHGTAFNRCLSDAMKKHGVTLPFCHVYLRNAAQQNTYADQLVDEYLNLFPEYRQDVLEGRRAFEMGFMDLIDQLFELVGA